MHLLLNGVNQSNDTRDKDKVLLNFKITRSMLLQADVIIGTLLFFF